MFIYFLIKNKTLEFWGVKIGKTKNPRQPFCRTFNFTSFGAYGLRFFASKLYILESFKHLLLFGPKWRNMTSSIKHNFLRKKKLDGFLNFGGRRQIDAR